MKQKFIMILNDELDKVLLNKKNATLNQDLMMKLVWTKVAEKLREIIIRVQDQA